MSAAAAESQISWFPRLTACATSVFALLRNPLLWLQIHRTQQDALFENMRLGFVSVLSDIRLLDTVVMR